MNEIASDASSLLPQVLVLAGPSGAGKDTILNLLIQQAGFTKLRTCTTRPKRLGEIDGKDYDFLSVDDFMGLRETGQLLDHVVITGHHYGLPLGNLNEAIIANCRVAVHLAVGSAFLLKQRVPSAKLVFILPPSEEEQIARLRSRGMSEAEIVDRLRDDPTPISTCRFFDLIVVNHNSDIGGAFSQILTYLQTQKTNMNTTNINPKTYPRYLCTGNINKLREFNEMLPVHLRLEQINIDLPEPQGVSLDEVVKTKALSAFEATGKFVLVEDSSLEISAWGGLPGALIKWFMQTVGNEGLIRMLRPFELRTATAKTALAFYDGQQVRVFTGAVDGIIVTEARGTKGFGWDPIFQPIGSEKTFGEMTPDEKNKVSMRRMALDNLVSAFTESN